VTSNCRPDDLYQEGLKRDQFLPAIEHLKMNTTILTVDNGIDYREGQVLYDNKHYLSSFEHQEEFLNYHFERLRKEKTQNLLSADFRLCDRAIHAVRRTESLLWMDFPELCKSPRGKRDYIELADQYDAIFVSHLPVFSAETDDQARRFIAFMDEIYDHQIELFIAAAANPENLYQGERHRFAFQRTVSRLNALKGEA
jgi:cell division protein ZapE